jgi:hypothetical protein
LLLESLTENYQRTPSHSRRQSCNPRSGSACGSSHLPNVIPLRTGSLSWSCRCGWAVSGAQRQFLASVDLTPALNHLRAKQGSELICGSQEDHVFPSDLSARSEYGSRGGLRALESNEESLLRLHKADNEFRDEKPSFPARNCIYLDTNDE